MTSSRERLQDTLESVMHDAYEERVAQGDLVDDFSKNVWFQAPPRLRYPAIIYERAQNNAQYADNFPYIYDHRYQVTVIDPDPDSNIPDKIARLPKCISDRSFVAENLHHDVFMIYS